MPRYPDIQVPLRSPNPLVLVSAVRLALRRAGVERTEIDDFSTEAMSARDGGRMRKVCREWVDTARAG